MGFNSIVIDVLRGIQNCDNFSLRKQERLARCLKCQN